MRSPDATTLHAPPSIGVVIVAAGRGLRFGGSVPKQFQDLGGQPVFMHSLYCFDRMQSVSKLVLVMPASGEHPDISGWLEGRDCPVIRVIGGERRQDSSANGLEALLNGPSGECDVAMVHDAARPFVDPDAVSRLAMSAMQAGGGVLASRCRDTVKAEDGAGKILRTLDRDEIWLAQTPQAIRMDHVSKAIECCRDPAIDATDEAAVLEKLGIPVRPVESSWINFKITSSEDLAVAESILAGRS